MTEQRKFDNCLLESAKGFARKYRHFTTQVNPQKIDLLLQSLVEEIDKDYTLLEVLLALAAIPVCGISHGEHQ